jgi:hypothetical protein
VRDYRLVGDVGDSVRTTIRVYLRRESTSFFLVFWDAMPLGTYYRAYEGAFGMMSKYLLFSHTQSSSSVSATNSQ